MTLRTAMRASVALLWILVASAAVAAGARYAFLQIFGQFALYDDEGYIMTSVRTFLDGLPLYDRTFTQYGPFYYAFMGTIYRITRIPIGHDATRVITIVVWIGTAALLGYFVFRVTRSFALALAVHLQAVLHSTGHIGEPGHPQGLLVLLLAAMLVSSSIEQPSVAAIAMGALGAFLVMTKINVGLFAVAAAAIALAALAPATRLWRGALCLMALAFAVLPVPLMRSNLSGWAWPYAVLAACAIAAASLSAWRVRTTNPASKPIWQFAVATAAVVVLVIVWTLLSGTSMRALARGMLIAPLRFGSLFTIPWALPHDAIWYGAAGLAAAAVAASFRPSPWLKCAGAVARIAFAVVASRAALQDPKELAMIAPFVWVLLLPVDEERSTWTHLLPRVFLCVLAAGQVLVAYPVAGNQRAWATLLLLPAAAVALADGVTLLPPLRIAFVRGLAEAALLAGVVYWFYPVYQVPGLRERYRVYAPLNLPHAEMIHLPRAERRTYQDIVSAIRADCDTFVGMPGLGSFYFWAETPPLTGFNATAWMTLFDDRTQQQIVYALSQHRSGCVLYHEGLVQGWIGGRPIEDKPLVQYIRKTFHPVRTIGDYQILMRNDRE